MTVLKVYASIACLKMMQWPITQLMIVILLFGNIKSSINRI